MSRPDPPAPGHDDPAAEAAARWVVGLSDDDPAAREAAREGFADWKRKHPQHGALVAAMERLVEQARGLGEKSAPVMTNQANPADPTRQARQAARGVLGTLIRETPKAGRSKRHAGLLGVLGLLMALPLALVLAFQSFSPALLLADLRTAPGEQRELVLADGTHLTLSTASAVNVRLEAGQRRLELIGGEILVEVAKDPARPFLVETAHGSIQALGTRFIVRREAEGTRLTMLESRTLLRPLAKGTDPAPVAEIIVTAGQAARMSAAGVEMLGDINPGLVEEAFIHCRLVVQDRPLPEILDELARHRSGFIRYERQSLQAMRGTAVLSLDDTDQALQLLANSFPQLRIRRITPWLVLVDGNPG